ncbi:MAG TPA: hypothetical protein VMC43_02690, partial [Candidatus Paceibacterota bacterium]|nr:hypothetical protein [Candidatus Paceibacterota bacterium]
SESWRAFWSEDGCATLQFARPWGVASLKGRPSSSTNCPALRWTNFPFLRKIGVSSRRFQKSPPSLE